MNSITLQVSVVTYFAGNDLSIMLNSLFSSAAVVNNIDVNVTIVENGYDVAPTWLKQLTEKYKCNLILPEENLGFGKAHNLTLSLESDFHLILNEDVILDKWALTNALKFMQRFPDCGLLSPSSHWSDGKRQYLCKRYPKVFDLLLRGFAPNFIKSKFEKRLSRYEMSDVINSKDVYWNPPIVSGCFMFFRKSTLTSIGGFDERFFLYFEDFDLSLRASNLSQVAYVPSVKIIHHGGHASKKGIRHIWMFFISMVKFFIKYKSQPEK